MFKGKVSTFIQDNFILKFMSKKVTRNMIVWEKWKPGIIEVKVCSGEIRAGLSSRLCQKEIRGLRNNLKCTNTLSKDKNALSKDKNTLSKMLCQKEICRLGNNLKDTYKSNIGHDDGPMHCKGTRLNTVMFKLFPLLHLFGFCMAVLFSFSNSV